MPIHFIKLPKIFSRATLLGLFSSAIVTLPAIAANTTITSADKRAADEYRQLGLSYRQQEKFDDAIAALQKSVSLDPDNVDGRIILGWTQHRAKQNDAAALSLWDAIYRSPTSLQAFNAIGIVYLVRGDLPQSVVLHSWAALLKPDNEIAHYNLSLAYQRLQQYDLAIAYAQTAIVLEPSNPHPLVASAIAKWSSGDQTSAKKTFREAIAVDPRYRSPEFLNFLEEAGFSPEQIQMAKQVLAST
ncbi:tetratricopeptide repeat protein [Pseudanabaena mucicola]|uniref:Tetratricopeptide repeat protein n=1 Tax=Pseudanabaena mucicola FACHB-723 TaxID=2692860 RepID=A0ABR7ZZ64_9CYAN|nr:tetratricopeptide repeat protein [Pseudanabaena mucicola]MBD2189296.1 tetratricopeptide repeat protein [Pseudanabaena mucicola FACHB-723]